MPADLTTAQSITPYSIPVLIRFRDCDPAGILFFARPYEYAHDAYENFVTHLGFTHAEWFGSPNFGTPIRQSACDYFKPMRAGEEIQIHVHLAAIGESSFTLKFSFESAPALNTGMAVDKRCEVTLTLVTIDMKTFKKMPLPSRVRDRLESYKI